MSDKKTEEKKEVLKPAFELENHKKDVDFILKNGTIKDDTLTLSQGDTEEFLKGHGVGRDTLDTLKTAIDRLDTAAVVATTTLLDKNIRDTIAAGNDASKLKAHFTARNAAFTHEATITASKEVNAGIAKPGEPAKRKTNYGTISVGMEVRGKVNEDLKEKVAESTRKALGL